MTDLNAAKERVRGEYYRDGGTTFSGTPLSEIAEDAINRFIEEAQLEALVTALTEIEKDAMLLGGLLQFAESPQGDLVGSILKRCRALTGNELVEIDVATGTVVPEPTLFIVRLFDGMDGIWIDVSEKVSLAEAERIWNEKTDGGKRKTKYGDIDYYKVFPADTVMHFSDEGVGEMRGR